MQRATVYVLPSVSPEPYPMAVLEAMSVGLPVVVTEDCGLAPVVRKYDCGIVIPPGAHNIARAVEALIAAPGVARGMGQRGRSAVLHDLGMSAIGRRLEDSYTAAAALTRWLA
jgi:glycosyltransferase involved in cell wall biosynthesis